MTARRLYTVEEGTSARAITGLLEVCFPDAVVVLDATYGNGKFWDGSANVEVIGLDRDPARARDVVGDFRALPLPARSVDVAVFDPPFQTDMGRRKASVMGVRFKTYRTIPELREVVEAGAREAWRVSRRGIIVKIQDYMHAGKLVMMSDWVRDALAPVDLYNVLHLKQPSKMADPKWKDQLSVWTNHATFLVFHQDGPVHRRRMANLLRVPQVPRCSVCNGELSGRRTVATTCSDACRQKAYRQRVRGASQ